MTNTALSDNILLSIEKPARYIGNEVNMVIKDPSEVDIRFCICFPDVYEVAMSHLGIQILYDMMNQWEDVYCERVYSPFIDLDKIMRESNIPLFALESQQPVMDFDFLGITLQYEMCYTNILQILDLSKIPLLSKDRTKEHPIVIGGGPCVYNPEPIADFFDIFYIGEGETVLRELLNVYKQNEKSGGSRISFLEKAAAIEGMYVPMFYDVSYNPDGTIVAFKPNNKHAGQTVKKQAELNLSSTYYPDKPLVPYIKAVQDRAVLEIQRGCIRGCRFCQAGMLYRPVRERSIEYLKEKADRMLTFTGHEEISLSSLSSSDYSSLKELVYYLIDRYKSQGINISLPSLRIDAFALDVMSKVQDIKKSSLTFAPEAGSLRLRNVINKGLTKDAILKGSMDAFISGWNKVKLYFMLGLPTENYKDIEEIAVLSDEIARQFYTIPKQERNGKVNIIASTSFFVPKPFTPFQWVRMDTKEEYNQKRKFLSEKLKEQLNNRSIKYNWHDSETTELEGVFARGDRKLSSVIIEAYQNGCLFDAWSEHFKYDVWMEAFEKHSIDVEFYNNRERKREEILPWDFIDAGITKQFLWKEYENAINETITPNCRQKCTGCGAAVFNGGICYEDRNKNDSTNIL